SSRAVHSSSPGNGGRLVAWRRAYSASSSPASSRTAFRARALSVFQALPPSFASVAAELQVQVVAHDAAHLTRVEPDEPPHTVVVVHHVVAGPQIAERGQRAAQ